jgi:hypothetical protein
MKNDAAQSSSCKNEVYKAMIAGKMIGLNRAQKMIQYHYDNGDKKLMPL